MADYAYREQAGAEAALEMRLGWLRDFAALGSAADRPLSAFTSRTHGTEQVVGYHKAAMVFLMLRDAIGKEAFDRALRAFWREHRGGVASWGDLRAAFEAASKQDLRSWFGQWLDRAGAPSPRLAAASAVRDGAGWRVDVEVTQSAPAYRLRLPLALQFEGGAEETRWVDFDGERQRFALHTERPPAGVALDPGARVFRRLAPGEAPPILRQAMLDPATVTVLAGVAATGESLARRFAEHPLRLRPATAPPPSQPLLLVGLASEVDRYLARHGLPRRPGELNLTDAAPTAWVWTAARGDGAPLTVVEARDEAALAALARPLPHYGRQSWLVFDGSKALARGVWPSRPQRIALGGG
jgi:hypothetical protein